MLQNIFLVAGLYVLFGGLVSWYKTSVFLAGCMKTKGLVVSHYYQTSSDEKDQTRSPFPIFQYYHPVTEMNYTIRSNVSGIFEEGKEIEILYDPNDPENAKIADITHTWMIPISVTFLGVFFSFIGILARNSVTYTYGVFDQIILIFLAIIFILTLNKALKIIFNDALIQRKL